MRDTRRKEMRNMAFAVHEFFCAVVRLLDCFAMLLGGVRLFDLTSSLLSSILIAQPQK